ncbi:MAG: Na(+)-translocating NADH-quinone reductase subunit A [Myxococcota bacterium]
MVFIAKKGLDLPISGQPAKDISDAPASSHVALLGHDYVGLRPRLLVNVGDRVKLGQPVFEDRTIPGVVFTAPACGEVAAVNRGAKRAFLSMVFKVDGDEATEFEHFSKDSGDTRDGAVALLLESGLWTALRTRPFSKTPSPESTPKSIFVTAVDSHPLAPDPDAVIAGREADFERGLSVLKTLTDGAVHLCVGKGSSIKAGNSGAQVSEFAGKHPCGTVGYHIHKLDPVYRKKTVWHIGYQDVLRIGHLFETGELDVSHVVSLAGPLVKKPRLLRTRIGASTQALCDGELESGEPRIISGSVLSGQRAMGDDFGFVGRFSRQVSVIAEGREREMLGWTMPGFNKFSTIPTFFSRLVPGKKFAMTSSTNGSRRAMVPIGMYERVMPMDLMSTHLLRAITVGDTEWAEELGVLELDEEDVSLCTFVCPGKMDYGPALRRTLDQIQKEG